MIIVVKQISENINYGTSKKKCTIVLRGIIVKLYLFSERKENISVFFLTRPLYPFILIKTLENRPVKSFLIYVIVLILYLWTFFI